MIDLGRITTRTCQGLSRREWLQIGSCGILGLTLADALRTQAATASDRRRREKSCIFIYLAGGPSQLETFDPKPDAPSRIRGPWTSIPSVVPGTRLSELMPQLARIANRYTLIRSMHHADSLHHPWPMMTGNGQLRTTYGAAVTFLKRGPTGVMPPYVHLGSRLSVGAGSLGGSYAPLEILDPVQAAASMELFALAQDIAPERLSERTALLNGFDGLRRRVDQNSTLRAHDQSFRQALSVLTSTAVRDAFDVSRESESLRDRYGANCFGQSCLLARRLIEAGTRFVQVMWYDREDGFGQGWDVHGDDQSGLERMEQSLCPRLDRGLSVLLEDLRQRGLLETTLVCVTGEFGRTPTISRLGGRDHWPYCFSVLMAGGGVPGGAVVGASDARAAYPNARPVTPPDFAATIYRLLGVDVSLDDRLRPAVFEGHPIDELCAG